MRIKVKSLPGDEYSVDVQNNQLVSDLKAIINEKAEGRLPADRQKLVFKGRTLHDSMCISDYNLEEDCRIHLIRQKTPFPDDSSGASPSSSSSQSASMHIEVRNGLSSSRLSSDQSANDSRDTSGVQMQSKTTLQGLPAHDRFSDLLSQRLMKHFQPVVHQRIMSKLQDEIIADINSSSLDDLERLAKQKLNITEE